MNVFQSPLFERRVKRFHAQEKSVLDGIIRKLADNPVLGEAKKGDLQGVFVHKFKIAHQQYLLAYRWQGADLELVMIGPHENYYRDLKQYLQSRP
jgi:hypothetical protein